MKIIDNTPDHLVLDQTPWVLGGLMAIISICAVALLLFVTWHREWLAAGLLAVVGTLVIPTAILMLVERRHVVLTPRELTLSVQNLRGTKTTTINSADIERATLDRLRQTVDIILQFRPAIVHANGTLPLRRGFQSGGRSQTIVDAINTWLAQHRDS